MPPARGVCCGVHNLQQKVRSAANAQVVAVDLRGKNFASSSSITETAALSLLGRIDNSALRFGASRLAVSKKPAYRRLASRSAR
jgi:hypothetical protein